MVLRWQRPVSEDLEGDLLDLIDLALLHSLSLSSLGLSQYDMT